MRYALPILAILLISINASAQGTPSSSGTGFFVSARWVATAAHVVEDCQRAEVSGYGVANRVLTDRVNDLALIEIIEGGGAALPFRDRPARLGEEVMTLGYPLSGILSDNVKMTSGNISSLAGLGGDTRVARSRHRSSRATPADRSSTKRAVLSAS